MRRSKHPWTVKQRAHLQRCIARGDTIAYWCSDAHGRPANHEWDMSSPPVPVRPGLVQKVDGPLRLCSEHALHATSEPHRWAGCRVWVVALVGEAAKEAGKLGALHREIIGEVLPEHAWSESVGVRIGRKDLYGANLCGANLCGADLYGANLCGANLHSADLRGANLPIGWKIVDGSLQRTSEQ